MNMDFVDSPSNLLSLLEVSDVEDIDILVDYLTDKGDGRISLDDKICRGLVSAKKNGAYLRSHLVDIAHEIKLFGGNTLVNLFRDIYRSISDEGGSKTVSYDEIVRDVAEHLDVSINKNTSIPTIEDGILRKILADAFEKMSDEERRNVLKELNITSLSTMGPTATIAAMGAAKMGGFATYKIALIVANAISKALLGKGLTFGGNVILTRSVSMMIGPIGWVVTGLWTLADMASPAYRVTVPCVVQIAYMRQKALAKSLSSTCPSCKAFNAVDARFCSECGSAMDSSKRDKSKKTAVAAPSWPFAVE